MCNSVSNAVRNGGVTRYEYRPDPTPLLFVVLGYEGHAIATYPSRAIATTCMLGASR